MMPIAKKMCKTLVKQMPGYWLRTALLRWAGYVIGNDAVIGEDLIIIDELADRGLVRIGDRAAVAPRVTLVVSSSPNWSRIVPYVSTKHAPITIESDVWIGAGSVVLPGVTIGEGAVVGANSVVSKDVPPYTIVWGTPARAIGHVRAPWVRLQEEPTREPA